jgi:ribosomal protein S27AE
MATCILLRNFKELAGAPTENLYKINCNMHTFKCLLHFSALGTCTNIMANHGKRFACHDMVGHGCIRVPVAVAIWQRADLITTHERPLSIVMFEQLESRIICWPHQKSSRITRVDALNGGPSVIPTCHFPSFPA